MDVKQAQEALKNGVEPSPEYPDLPNDFTAAELIAFDPKAELSYRLAKAKDPSMTRAKLMQSWRPFKIGRLFSGADSPSEKGASAALGKLAALFRRDR